MRKRGGDADMADSRRNVERYHCPSCFARGLDQVLRYDEGDDEYYCIKCCYVGTGRQVKEFFDFYIHAEYKRMETR
jgi:hypothetical protein